MIEQIRNARLSARKAKNTIEANILGLVIGQYEQLGSKATSDDVERIIKSLMKGINERLDEQYSNTDYNNAEIEKRVLSQFVKEQMTAEEVKDAALVVISSKHQDGGISMKDMGTVMKGIQAIAAKIGKSVDGKVASTIVRQSIQEFINE